MRPLKILISAAEASSDVHGAQLLKALQAESSGPVDAFGVGGPRLQEAGLRVLVDARELLSMGFIEVLGRLPRVLSALKELTEAAREAKPDVAVVIDYPDFHFRLARRLKRLGVPVIYYIPPKVWVWRKSRIRVLKDSFVKVLSILPFEVPFYQQENVPVTYVGTPLADELPLAMTREQARAKLGLAVSARVLVAMPGSRPSEIKLHAELMLQAAQRAAALLRSQGKLDLKEKLTVLMPFPSISNLSVVRKRVDRWLRHAGRGDFILDVRVSQGDSAECMLAADAGLIKSGTSTLEAALLGCPHAIVYKTPIVTEWIYKSVVRYQGPVGLSNLVARAGGEAGTKIGAKGAQPLLVNEILLSDVTVEALCAEVVSLLGDENRRREMIAGFADLKSKMLGAEGVGFSPSKRAAREVLAVVASRLGPQSAADANPGRR